MSKNEPCHHQLVVYLHTFSLLELGVAIVGILIVA